MNLIKTDRPIRHIIAKKLLCPNVNIAVRDDLIVVRMLFKREKIRKGGEIFDKEQLLGFDVLTNKYTIIDGTNYIVLAEGRFDLNDPSDKKIWVPGSNIIAEYDYVSLQQGIVRFFKKGPRTYLTKENSAEYGQRRGMSTPLQLFCRSVDDSLVVCSKSVVSQKDGLFITNMDKQTMVEIDPFFVNNVHIASKFLNLQYRLKGPHQVPKGSVFDCVLEVREEMKDKICEIYNNTLYAASDGGYIPVRAINVKNGRARFKVSTLGLNAGDTITIKVGTKVYTNYDEITVSIVD